MKIFRFLQSQSISPLACELLSGGLRHEVYKVQTHDGVLIVKTFTPLSPRFYPRVSVEERQASLEGSEAIAHQLIAALPVVVAQPRNERFSQLFEGSLYLIFDYDPGHAYDATSLNEIQRNLLAEDLARLHLASPDMHPFQPEESPEFMWTSLLDALDVHNPEIGASFKGYLPQLQAWSKLADGLNEKIVLRVCHGDLHLGNILWSGIQRRWIDWERAGYGCSEAETLGLALECAGVFTATFNPDILIGFLKAYLRAQGPWTLSTLNALNLWLGETCAAWCYEALTIDLERIENSDYKESGNANASVGLLALENLQYLSSHLDTIKLCLERFSTPVQN